MFPLGVIGSVKAVGLGLTSGLVLTFLFHFNEEYRGFGMLGSA